MCVSLDALSLVLVLVFGSGGSAWGGVVGWVENVRFSCVFSSRPWSRTQTLSLAAQYALGVRVFDVRYGWDDDCHTYLVFNGLPTAYSLGDALVELVEVCAHTLRVVLCSAHV